MKHDDIRDELEKLRQQVAGLSTTKRRHRETQEQETKPDEEADATAEQGEAEHAIRKQLEDLVKMFQEEIHDMPAMPTLAVFMLGVIVGRYLRE